MSVVPIMSYTCSEKPLSAAPAARNLLAGFGLLVLSACGNNYQAPVAERSEILDRSGPEIVARSDDSPSRYGGGPVITATGTRYGASPVTVPATYQVSAGQSLYSIAYQYDLDVRRIAELNGLTPPYSVTPGQTLRLQTNAARDGGTAATGESSGTFAGRVVENNSVARAQPAATATGGVTRQPIVSSPIDPAIPAVAEPDPVQIAAVTQDPSRTVAALPVEPAWRWPIAGNIVTNFQSDSSARRGIDIGGSEGQPVHAAATGDVVYAGNGIQGSGNLVILRHNDQLLSAYAFNRNLLVQEGQRVLAGEQIAEMGTNPEGAAVLHFEIRLDGKPVDPMGYLPRL